MLTNEQKNAAVAESASPLHAIEADFSATQANLTELSNAALTVQAALDLTNCKCARIDRRLNRVMTSFDMFKGAVEDLHEDATRMLNEEGMPVPLAGGGNKPPAAE
ncbi:MAG: hypothetical protein JKY52_08290 [Flavobacteriales bacterium]|nr:hypothetical protein [Flavobacteriales bacterium]